MSRYRIDPTRIIIPETERGKWSERNVVSIGKLAPALDSTAPESRQTVAVKKLEWRHVYKFDEFFKVSFTFIRRVSNSDCALSVFHLRAQPDGDAFPP